MSRPRAWSPSCPQRSFATRACPRGAEVQRQRPRLETPSPGSSSTEDTGQQGTSITRHVTLGRVPAPQRAAKHPGGDRAALVSSAEHRAMQTSPTATPGAPASAPAVAHTGQRARGLRGDTGLRSPAPALLSTLTSCCHPTGPTVFSGAPQRGARRAAQPDTGQPCASPSAVPKSAALFPTRSRRGHATAYSHDFPLAFQRSVLVSL